MKGGVEVEVISLERSLGFLGRVGQPWETFREDALQVPQELLFNKVIKGLKVR